MCYAIGNSMQSSINQEQKEIEERQTKLTEEAQSNLSQIEEQIEQSSTWFKPKEGKTYVIRVDPMKPMEPNLNDKFKTPDGKPTIRYSWEIEHPNTGKFQTWEVSKTVCLQIVAKLKKGFTFLEVERTGTDRTTTYSIKGVQ